MKKRLESIKKQIYLFFITFSIILAIISASINLMFIDYSDAMTVLKYSKEMVSKEKIVQDYVNRSNKILLTIRNSIYFQDYLEDTSHTDNLKSYFLDFASHYQDFMQISFLDAKGMEKVRLNRSNIDNYSYIIEDNKLQDKSHTYYFKDAKFEKEETIRHSAIESNLENNKSINSYILHSSYKVFYENKFMGVILVSYYLEDLLNILIEDSLYDIYLFNKKGHKIICNTNSKCNLHNIFLQEKSNILSQNIYSAEDFISKHIDTDIKSGLIMIWKLKDSYKQLVYTDNMKRSIIQFVIILIISLILLYIFNTLLNRRLNLNQQLLKIIEDKTEENIKQNKIIQQQAKMTALGEKLYSKNCTFLIIFHT
jgi:hypothetical protein